MNHPPGADMRAAAPFRWLPILGQTGLLAALYFAAAKASLLLAIPPGYVTALWPPAGIALAALLLWGNRVWPGVWLGAALANLTVDASPLVAAVIATGNTLEALAGSALVRRYIAAAPPYFDRARDVVLFVAFAALSAAVAATLGTAALMAEGAVRGGEFAFNWGTWWIGDTAGIIIMTPLALTWRLRHRVAWTPAKVLELAGLAASLLLVTFVVFGQSNAFRLALPLTFLILPLIVWAAFRFSRREVTTAIAAVCAMAVWHTIAQRGPFALESLNLSLTLLLAFISCVVATGLMLSAAVGERDRIRLQLERVLQATREQAHTDALTGLANRRSLEEFLQRAWSRAQHDGGSLAVVMMDLDHFKRVNDRFGHEAGDLVLSEVAGLLKTYVRPGDMACRLGGEEFALVLPEAAAEAVRRRAEQIRRAIERRRLRHRGQALGAITASFGIALFPGDAADPESLLRAADEALYAAKGAGRNRVVLSGMTGAGPRPVRYG